METNFLNVRICWISLQFMIEHEESFGFGVLVGRKKQLQDDALAFWVN